MKRNAATLAPALWKLLLTCILAGFGITMVLPFLWMLSTSFKFPIDVFNYPIEWIPK